MADEIKLSNSGLSSLRPDAVAGQNETSDALVSIFSDFWQSESIRISDQDLSKNGGVSGNVEAAIIENNDIKISGMNLEIATIERLPKSENYDVNVTPMEDVALQGQTSSDSKLSQNYYFIDDGAAPINEEADELNLTDISAAFSWHAESETVDDIVFFTQKEFKVINYRSDYQNVDFRMPSSDFFLHQNTGMTVERAPTAKLIDEAQILFDTRNQSGIFKSIIASEDINPKPQMGPILLKNSGYYMKNNNFIEVIKEGINLFASRYLDISTPETSLTILPKLKSTEQNSYPNLKHPSQILIDGKTEKAIETVVGLYVTESTDIKVRDNKDMHPNAQSKVIRVDVLKKTWEQQVVSKLVSGIKENDTSIDLILQPKKLGEVSVQIVRDANNVSIKLTTENQNVANLFKATEIQLETLLFQNGMKLAGFTVGYDNQGRDNRNSQQSNNSKNGILLKKKSEKSDQNDSMTESIALSRHVGDYDYLV